MSKTALNKLCKKGVSSLRKKDVANDGPYPVYGASGIVGYSASYQNEKRYVAVIKDGAGVGRACLCESKSSVLGTMQALIPCEDVDCDYLLYLVRSMRLGSGFTGSTIPHIYFKDYGKRLLPKHDNTEQRYIADSLNAVEAQIAVHVEQIERLNGLVKSRFVEMFGDVRTNEFNWPVRTFEELADVITDGEHATPKRQKKGIYLLSARNVKDHMLDLSDVDYIGEDEYQRIARRIVPQESDVLISCSGTIGKCCVVPAGLRFQMVRSAALIRFSSAINPVYAEWLITSDDLQEQIRKSATQSSQANLFQGRIRKLCGIVPPLSLQEEFAAFVAQVHKLKADTQLAIDKLQMLYDSLAQEYFAGE